MEKSTLRRLGTALGILALLALGVKYVLPAAMPFLVGGLVAAAAEPLVRLSQRRLRLSRGFAAGLGVSVTLLLLAGLLSILGAFFLKEMVQLASSLPDLESTARDGVAVLKSWLEKLTCRAPDGLQPMLTRTVDGVFENSSVLVDQATARIPAFLSGFLSGVPDSALKLGTGLLAAFMLSARLPKLKEGLARHIPQNWKDSYIPALARTKKALGGWLKAQGLLSAVTYGIVSLGLLLLQVPYSFLWAFFVALIDAVPMLGTGIVLLPWALVSLLQGQHFQAIGLVLTFGAATLTRTTLEPRLVGRQLGLDPLLTLIALYCGHQIWGFWGLLVAPVLTAAVKSFVSTS